MNLQEYKDNKQKVYKKFAKTIKNILDTIIRKAIKEAQKTDGYCYHLQQIQYRAKNVESIEKRLAEKGLSQADEIDKIFPDLAGCRIIFYGNYDVSHFLYSELIYKNFNVSKYKTHFPKNKEPENRYTADHYIIKLNKESLSLQKYQMFKE